MHSSKKVAINTGILYIRMIFTVLISLYSTRLILNTLGEIDYGIYNLTTGMIAMLAFLSTAMSTSTQRNLTFNQNKEELLNLKKVFINSLFIHIVLGVAIIVLFELSVPFLFDKVLRIPVDRVEVAKKVFHYISIIFLLNFVTIPYYATLIAHENILWIAFVNVLEVVLKLILALSLSLFSADKLISYAFFSLIITGIVSLCYVIYCSKNYIECELKVKDNIDLNIIKKMISFTSWNLFGSLSAVSKTQGIAILLNVFFGPTINAAYGIANQVSSQLNFFSVNMLNALNPQIVKSESSGNRARMLRLSMIGSKFGFLLLAFIAIPCIFEMDLILKLWLKAVPFYASGFCSLILVAIMFNQLTIGLDCAIQAIGKIKKYMLVVGSVKMLIIPISYILLKLNFSVYYVLTGYALIELIAGCFRLYILNSITGLSISNYMYKVIYPLLPTVFITTILDIILVNVVKGELSLIINISLSIVVFFCTAYFISLNTEEKSTIDKVVLNIIDKGRKKFVLSNS